MICEGCSNREVWTKDTVKSVSERLDLPIVAIDGDDSLYEAICGYVVEETPNGDFLRLIYDRDELVLKFSAIATRDWGAKDDVEAIGMAYDHMSTNVDRQLVYEGRKGPLIMRRATDEDLG